MTWRYRARVVAESAIVACVVAFFVVASIGVGWPIMEPVTSVVVWMRYSRRAGRREIALLEGDEPDDVALVEAIFRRGGRVYAVDRGVVWIADEMVHFRGVACYFGLTGADFTVARDRDSTTLRPVAFDARSVEFWPLRRNGSRAPHRYREIMSGVAELARYRSRSSEPRVMPPLSAAREEDPVDFGGLTATGEQR